MPRRASSGVSPKRVMASPLQTSRIREVLQEKEGKMLEWQARILTLMIAFLPFWDRLGDLFTYNWNW